MDGQVEEPHRMISLLQGWEDFPGDEMKYDDMGNGGEATRQGVFNELKDRRVIYGHGFGFRCELSEKNILMLDKVVVYTRYGREKPVGILGSQQ